MRLRIRRILPVTAVFTAALSLVNPAVSQQRLELTLDKAVEIAMDNSYRIKQLQMGIERNRYWLKSRQAGLKSRVYMNIKAPEYKAVSDYKWNSTLKKDEIFHEDTQLWQMDLAIRQPVMLMGYPTNGYLSLNNRTYKYVQKDGGEDVDYYNRYYVKFEQPFFLPNSLKNDIEDAELDLDRRELEYIRDRVWLINSIADDYYDLFEYTYRDSIYSHQIANLDRAAEVALEIAERDTSRAIDCVQIRVEIANVRERRLRNQSNIRRESARIKQSLRMSQDDDVIVRPSFPFKRVNVDTEQAIEYGYSLSPTLRMLNIDRRKGELDVDNAKGYDSFHLNLEMTYGLEKQHDRYQSLWDEFDNSYSAAVSAYIPIWDWGRRKARIETEKIDLRQTELRIEENRTEIRSDIMIAVQNLLEYQDRTENMMESRAVVQQITDSGLEQYRNGNISLQDMIQIIDRQEETENNFLDAYQGYRRSLIELMMQTYYDYENNVSLIDKFRVETEG